MVLFIEHLIGTYIITALGHVLKLLLLWLQPSSITPNYSNYTEDSAVIRPIRGIKLAKIRGIYSTASVFCSLIF